MRSRRAASRALEVDLLVNLVSSTPRTRIRSGWPIGKEQPRVPLGEDGDGEESRIGREAQNDYEESSPRVSPGGIFVPRSGVTSEGVAVAAVPPRGTFVPSRSIASQAFQKSSPSSCIYFYQNAIFLETVFTRSQEIRGPTASHTYRNTTQSVTCVPIQS